MFFLMMTYSSSMIGLTVCFVIDVDDDRTTDEDGRFRILGT